MKAVFVALLLTMPFSLSAEETDKAAVVRWLVAHQDDLKDVPFGDVVMAATGKRILPVDPKRDAVILQKLGVALDATLLALNEPSHLIHRAGRVNEASRFIEDEIRKQVNLLPGWKCTIPRTTAGREQRSGYPDLRIVTGTGAVIYLDPKLYAAGSQDSSLRTFYYEPRSLTGKIQDDALHLLAGIEHDGNKASAMRLTRWDLIDVSKLRVSLKAEFQAGNDGIYRSDMIVGRSAK